MEGGNRGALKQIPCCLVTRGAEGSCKIWLNSEGAIKMAFGGVFLAFSTGKRRVNHRMCCCLRQNNMVHIWLGEIQLRPARSPLL